MHPSDLQIGCVVMAAGDARRFGQNKLLQPFRGRPLIDYALDAANPALFCQIVVVTQYDAIAVRAAARGCTVLRNEHPDWGVSHTICLGTKALQACDGILYLVSDQPLLTRASVARIVAEWRQHPDCIVGAASGEARGNPNLFPQKYFPDLLHLQGDRGGTRVIRQHPEVLRIVQVPEAELHDCDTPAALEQISF